MCIILKQDRDLPCVLDMIFRFKVRLERLQECYSHTLHSATGLYSTNPWCLGM